MGWLLQAILCQQHPFRDLRTRLYLWLRWPDLFNRIPHRLADYSFYYC